MATLVSAASPLAADEGMWMPQQIPDLAEKLRAMGFEGDPAAFADLTGQPMGAIVSLGGCTASFVSPEGLIATNHHVVRNSRYLAVQFADGRKVLAAPVLLDPRYDLAILRINRTLVAALEPLPLLPAERDGSVKAGVQVLAFGSPLSQTFMMTQGIVSKAEPDVLLGDFLIQPGNSGGP